MDDEVEEGEREGGREGERWHNHGDKHFHWIEKEKAVNTESLTRLIQDNGWPW